jgi:hypothetical protein
MPPLTDRDKLVNAPNALLTLASPRTDTPATLVSPVEPAASVLARPASTIQAELAAPVTDPSVGAFLQIAVIADLKMADPSERPAIIANAKSLTTGAQVQAYMQSVMQRASTATPPPPKGPVITPVISQVAKNLQA